MLFQGAARRVVLAAKTISIRGLVIHALSEKAKTFYRCLGLDESPLALTTIADLRAALDA